MNENEKIILLIEGQNIKYQKEITEALAVRIMQICSTKELFQKSEINSEEESYSLEADYGRPQSPAEYLNKYGPQRNPDKILAFASFLEEIRNQNRFSPNEIKKLFVDAGEVVPANFTRDFKWVITSSWVANDPSKKGIYYVTSTGKRVIKEGFPKELIKKTSQSKSFKGRKKTNKKDE